MSKDPKSRSSDSRPIPHRSVCVTAFGTPRSVPVVPQRLARVLNHSERFARTPYRHPLVGTLNWQAYLARLLGTHGTKRADATRGGVLADGNRYAELA